MDVRMNILGLFSILLALLTDMKGNCQGRVSVKNDLSEKTRKEAGTFFLLLRLKFSYCFGPVSVPKALVLSMPCSLWWLNSSGCRRMKASLLIAILQKNVYLMKVWSKEFDARASLFISGQNLGVFLRPSLSHYWHLILQQVLLPLSSKCIPASLHSLITSVVDDCLLLPVILLLQILQWLLIVLGLKPNSTMSYMTSSAWCGNFSPTYHHSRHYRDTGFLVYWFLPKGLCTLESLYLEASPPGYSHSLLLLVLAAHVK